MSENNLWNSTRQNNTKLIKLEGYLHPPQFEGDGFYLTDSPQFNEEAWLEAEDIDYILDNLVGKKVRVTIEVIE